MAQFGQWGKSTMGSKRGLAAAAVLSVGLGGCVAAWGDSHKITRKDEASITIEFDPMFTNDDEMLVLADSHCGPRGGKAALLSERKTIGGIDVRNYKCEPVADAEKPPIELLREALNRFRAKDWAGAEDLASKALAQGSLSVNQAAAAHTLRGFCRFAAGRLNEALADLNRAVQLRPDFTAAVEFREALLRVSRARQRAPGPRSADEVLQPPIIQF
jgi:hypothetical protein